MSENGPLRVLLASSSSGSCGGGELYLVGLAQGLHELGHDVHALLAAHPRMDQLDHLLRPWAGVHRTAYTNTYDRPLRCFGACLDRKGIRRLADSMQSIRPDIVHVNKQNLEDGLDLLAAARRCGLPFLATIHITRSMAALGAVAGRWRDACARRVLGDPARTWIAIADACAGELAAHLGGRGRGPRVERVWNGVAVPRPGDRDAVRQGWGCSDQHLVLGCVARLERQKNPLFLLEMLARLPSHVRLVWVGDGRLRNEFLQAARQLGVAERVHLDGWRSDACQRLAGFDVFVLPSQFEGLPLAVLEAMAAGLPIVASDVDGVREAVVDGVTGRLCRYHDQPDWLAALSCLVADRPLRTRLGEAARRRHQQHFSLEAMARATEKVYRSLVGDGAAERGSSSGPSVDVPASPCPAVAAGKAHSRGGCATDGEGTQPRAAVPL